MYSRLDFNKNVAIFVITFTWINYFQFSLIEEMRSETIYTFPCETDLSEEPMPYFSILSSYFLIVIFII